MSLSKEIFNQKCEKIIVMEAIETWKSSLLRYILFKSIGAKNRVGRNSDGRGIYLNIKVHEDILSTIHEIDRKLLIAKTLGAKINSTKQEFPVSPEDRKTINNWLLDSGVVKDRVIVAIHPGSFVPTRQWTPEGFIEIGKRLYDRYNAQIIITGGSNDEVVYDVANALRNVKPVTAAGFSLGELGALMEQVHLFVTNDTGPCHIADAIDTLMVVIFGPENHNRYCPYNTRYKSRVIAGLKASCSPCLKYTCRKHDCMKDIAPDDVWKEVASVMDELTSHSHAEHGNEK